MIPFVFTVIVYLFRFFQFRLQKNWPKLSAFFPVRLLSGEVSFKFVSSKTPAQDAPVAIVNSRKLCMRDRRRRRAK